MFDTGYRMLGAGARGWSREMIWVGRWEGGSWLGTHVHLWLIHVNVWQNQYSIAKQIKVKIKIKKKKKWQEYTEEIYKKDLNDPDNHNGVITHREPDILECELNWAFGSIAMNKASGGDGIPTELFQTLWKCCTLCMPPNLENSAVAKDWKRSVFIPIPKKGNAKECSNYHAIALTAHASKVTLKILQARLQQ